MPSANDTVDVITIGVLGFVAFRLVSGLRVSGSPAGRSLSRSIVRRIRWRHVWPVPFLLTAIIAIATQIMRIPGLGWGWWSVLGGEGNPVFGSSDTTVGTSWEWIVPLVFMCLLIPALPLFAHAEERLFRAGAESWSIPHRVLKLLQFGLAHCIVGVPLGVGLTLSLGGLYFMWVYLQRYDITRSRSDATIESAAAHTAYNGLIVALVLVALLAEALVR